LLSRKEFAKITFFLVETLTVNMLFSKLDEEQNATPPYIPLTVFSSDRLVPSEFMNDRRAKTSALQFSGLRFTFQG
jgi:hypothetical protein